MSPNVPPLSPPATFLVPRPRGARECGRTKATSVPVPLATLGVPRCPSVSLNVPFERGPRGPGPPRARRPLAGIWGCSAARATLKPRRHRCPLGPPPLSPPCHHRHVPEGHPPPPARGRAAGGAGSVAGVPNPRVHAARGLWHRGLACHPVLQLLVQRVDLGGHFHHLALPGRGLPRQHLHLPLRQGPALHRRRGDIQGAHGVGGEPAAPRRLHRHPQPGAQRQRHLHVRRQEPARHRGQVLAGHPLRAGESAHPLRRRAGLCHRRGPAAGGRAGGPGLCHPLLLAAAPGGSAAAAERHGEGEAAALGQGRLQAQPAGPGALRHAGPRPQRQESQGRRGGLAQG